jgi:hypothetical protein
MPRDGNPDLSDDERLLAELGAALDDAEPVPDDLVGFATASLTWRTVGAELAELLFDSAQDETVAVRAAPTAAGRLLSFGHGERGVELELDAVRLVGVVRPAGRYAVELQGTGATDATTSDAGGMFEVATPPPGPLRLVVTPVDGPPGPEVAVTGPGQPAGVLVTPWFEVR